MAIAFAGRRADGEKIYLFATNRTSKVRDVRWGDALNILEQTADRRPLYLAVTVPDKMGVGDRLVMEGLARRIHPTPQAKRVDVEAARRNFYVVFTPFHGILTPEGATDTTFYLDETVRRLVQNYAAIHF